MIQDALTLVWRNINQISPSIFWASLLFLIGIIASKSMEGLTVAFLNKLRLNKVLKSIGLPQTLEKIDIKFDGTKFFGEIVKWFFIILFLMISSEILELDEFSKFLQTVIAYYPNIFIASLLFIFSAFLADFSQKIVVGTLEKERIIYSRFLGRSIRWIIWFFAILAILYQLKITPSLIATVFVGMVVTISLALGIAFGLGGKDLAQKILKDLEKKFK